MLRQLDQEALQQRAVLSAVQQHLPLDLADHCRAARFDGQRLVIHTDSPVWASRLRFFSNQLSSLLQNDLTMLREIKVKLIPRRANLAPAPVPRRRSAYAADIVGDTARHTASAELKAALERLSLRLREKP